MCCGKYRRGSLCLVRSGELEKTRGKIESFNLLDERWVYLGTPDMAAWKSTMVLHRDGVCMSMRFESKKMSVYVHRLRACYLVLI